MRSRVDRDAGSIGTGYLFRGNFEGTIGNNSELTGTKWGIHIEGANRNAIEGHLQVGAVTTGSEKTYTTLYVDATDGARIPVGTTAQRPTPANFGIDVNNNPDYAPMIGTIRYNTTQSTFEGFGPGNQWGSLGGVIDVDRDTYWTAINDLNNIHDLGGDKYGTDEFDSPDIATDYPGDVDYLRAFTVGKKRYAITDTGSTKWYYHRSGVGSQTDPYVYDTVLQVVPDEDSVTIQNPTASSTLLLKTTGRLTVDGDGGVSINGSGSEIDITSTGAAIDMNSGSLDIDTTGGVAIDGTGISLDSDAASNFTTSVGALTLKGAGGVNINGTGDEIDITSTSGTIDMNAGTAVSLDGHVPLLTSTCLLRTAGCKTSNARLRPAWCVGCSRRAMRRSKSNCGMAG